MLNYILTLGANVIFKNGLCVKNLYELGLRFAFVSYILSASLFFDTTFGFLIPLLGVGLTVAALLRLVSGGSLSISLWLLYIPFAAFASLLLTDTLIGSFSELSLALAVAYQVGVVLFVLVYSNVIKLSDFYVIVYSGVYLVLDGFVSAPDLAMFRFNTLYGESINQAALLLSLGVGVSIFGIKSSLQKNNCFTAFVLLVALLVLLAGVVLLGSRQGLILSGLWISALLFVGWKKWFFAMAIVVFGLVYYKIDYFSGLYIWERIQGVLSLLGVASATGERSIGVRADLIEYGLANWSDHFVVGQGIRAFEKVTPFGKYSHNNYIELLYNHGLSGLLLYYIPFIILLFWCLWKRGFSPGRDRFYIVLLVYALFYVLIQGFFIVHYFRYVTWIAVLLLLYSAVNGGIFGTSHCAKETPKRLPDSFK